MIRESIALRHRGGSLIAALLLLMPIPAAAAAPNSTAGSSEVLFFAQLALLLVVGRLLGEAANRIGQPTVIGQLLGGLILGPSVFGLLFPSAQHFLFPTGGAQKSMIDAVADLGVLMLLLLTGMETDLKLVRRVGTPPSRSQPRVWHCLSFAALRSVSSFRPNFCPDPTPGW
jgi:Sodium/hydrogen exchanger family